MIDKHPAEGNWTYWIEYPYSDTSANTGGVLLHDAPPVRQSSILGPDGNPVLVDIPRRRIGFDLTPRKAK